MSKFNQTQTNKTVNKSGHTAYKMKDREKLVTQVCTSFFNESKFYGDNSADMQETIKRVIQTDPQNDIWVHAIDLQGYGTQQFCGKKTNIIAGWSEKVLDFIKLAEQGEGNLEKTIEQYSY